MLKRDYTTLLFLSILTFILFLPLYLWGARVQHTCLSIDPPTPPPPTPTQNPYYVPLTNSMDLCNPIPNATERIIFYHIPKVSGSYITQTIKKEKEIKRVWTVGHCGYNQFLDSHVYKNISDPVLMLMLRPPIERIHSEFYHAVYNVQIGEAKERGTLINWDHRSIYTDSEFVKDFIDGKYNLTSFVQLGDINPANNRLTRTLAGVVGSWPDNLLWSSDFSVYLSTIGSDTEKKQVMLKKAKENLSKFHIIGLTTRQNETYAMIEKVFNFSYPFKTKEAYYKSFPYEAEVILKHNELDTELMQFAEQLFDKRLSCPTKFGNKREN